MKYKLTMVSITCRGRRLTKFVKLPVEASGPTRLPGAVLDKMLDELGCRHGDTYSVS